MTPIEWVEVAGSILMALCLGYCIGRNVGYGTALEEWADSNRRRADQREEKRP